MASKKSKKKRVQRKEVKKEKELRRELNLANFIELTLEVIVLTLIIFSIFNMKFYINLASMFVIPLSIANFILSIVENNRSQKYTLITMVLAWTAVFVSPVIGVLFIVFAGISTVLSIQNLTHRIYELKE